MARPLPRYTLEDRFTYVMESSSGGLIPLAGAASFGGRIETDVGNRVIWRSKPISMDGTGHGDWVSTVHVLMGREERWHNKLLILIYLSLFFSFLFVPVSEDG